MADDDLQLLDAWRDGDAAAGSELFRRYFKPLLRFFFNKAGDADVEDLIQKTMLACVGSRDRFRGASSFRTYLFRIARNELLMSWRRRRSRGAGGGGGIDFGVTSIADLGPSPSTIARIAEDRRLLLEALAMLPADMQLTLELHYWEGMSASELAEMFEVEPTTIRTRLHRARQQLKAAIEERSADPELRDRALESLGTWVPDA